MSGHDLTLVKLRPLLASAFVMAVAGSVVACASSASQGDYRFDVVNQPVPVGADSAITVRMIDAANGRPVNGATISEARLTMKMPITVRGGKGTRRPDRSHSEELQFVGASGVGQYSFLGDVSMPGSWTLILSARVPGESSPVEGSAIFMADRERHDP